MLNNNSITIFEANYSPAAQLEAFADTNAILELTNELQQPFLHFWTTTEPTLILGINDRHLPKLESGLEQLVNQRYQYFLRNSGGLAVISDPGVLNVSLFLPNRSHPLSVDDAYEVIAELMRQSLPQWQLGTYEITDSYCPGKYDLSVNGQKIAGIAQRREKDAIVLMLYMSVFGNQDSRSETVANFYEVADAYSQTKWNFPKVNKASMTSLVDLDSQFNTLDVMKEKISAIIQHDYSLNQNSAAILSSEQFKQQKARQLRKMILRNEQLPKIGGQH